MAILLLALVVLGPTRLPEAARQVGKAMTEFRRMSSGFQRELRDAIEEPMKEVKSGIKEPLNEMKRTLNEPVEEKKKPADPSIGTTNSLDSPKEKSPGGPEAYRAPAERSDDNELEPPANT